MEWINTELLRRKKKNPRFSVRAIAKLLKTSSGALSELMSGRRAFTFSTAAKFADQLKLTEEERPQLFSIVLAITNKQKEGAKKFPKAEKIEAERFRILADWYHSAILSLCRLKGSSASPYSIAKRLGISLYKAKSALARLESVGFLVIDNGQMRQAIPDFHVISKSSDLAIQRFHSQALSKAKESLQFHTVNDRYFSTLTVAVETSQLAKAKRAIDQFCIKMDRILESSKLDNDRVLQLAVLSCR